MSDTNDTNAADDARARANEEIGRAAAEMIAAAGLTLARTMLAGSRVLGAELVAQTTEREADAADRVALAEERAEAAALARVGRARQRLLDERRRCLADLRSDDEGTAALAHGRLLELAQKEVGILEAGGATPAMIERARQAALDQIAKATAIEAPQQQQQALTGPTQADGLPAGTHVRVGSRFVPVAEVNGPTNGTHG